MDVQYEQIISDAGKWLYTNYIGVMSWEVQAYESLGLTLSVVRFMISLFSAVLLGFFMFYIRGKTVRLIYSVLTGLLLVYYPFGNEIFLTLPPLLLTYAAMLITPKHCGQISWAVNFLYLLAWHYYAASGESWQQGELDFTGGQMVLTLKIIALATSRVDGTQTDNKKLTDYAKDKKLEKIPNLLEYFSYCFSCGNLLSGPFMEFKDFQDFIARQGAWSEIKDKKRIQFPVYTSLYYLASAATMLSIYLLLVPTYNIGQWLDLYDLTYFQRVLVVYIVCLTYRLKFYFVWTLAECSLIMSGFAFSGYEKNEAGELVAQWNRCNQVQMLKVELCDSCAIVPQYWNIGTGVFLRRYVYERLKGTAFMNMMITQIVSGLWHGLFPGQIMFFCFTAFLFQSAKVIYRFEKIFLPPQVSLSFPWKLVKILYTMWALNSLAATFLVVDFERSLFVWRALGFVANITVVVLTLLGSFLPSHKKKPKNGNLETNNTDSKIHTQ